MNKLYRLEYSSPQGVFHLAEKDEKPVFGWVTLTESCTCEEFFLFDLYVRARFKRKLQHDETITIIKVTNAQMIEAFRTWSEMMDILAENYREIVNIKSKQ